MENERQKAEASQDNDFYRLVFKSARDPILIIRPDGQVIDANNAIVEAVGYSKEELLKMNVADLRPPSERPKVADHLRQSSEGTIFQTEYMRKDGSVFPVEISTKGVLLNGKLAFLGIIRDITERKRAEEAIVADLRDTHLLHSLSVRMISEGDGKVLYQEIMDAAVAIMHSDYASMQIFVPERGDGGELYLLAYRGFTPEAAKFWEWVQADSASTCGMALRSCRRFLAPDVETCEFMAGSEDRATYLQTGIRAVQSTPLYTRTGKLVGMLSTHWSRPYQPSERELQFMDLLARQAADIIERKRAEEERERLLKELDAQRRKLEESVNIYRAIGEMIPFGIWICGLDGGVKYYSQSYMDMAGMTFEELKELGWTRQMPPEDVEPMLRDWKECITHGDFWTYEHRITGANGQKHVILSRGVPIKDEEGKTTCWAGINLDITELKEKEAALLDAITQADLYMDLMGHDINNINQTAMGFLELALMALESKRKLEPEDTHMVERPLKALQTSSRLIENVRKIKKLTSDGITIEPIDLRKVLADLDIQSLSSNGRDVTINIPEIPPSVVRANELFRDVLINLITNAVKHSSEEKPLLVNLNVDPAFIEDSLYYKCTVEDNGPGIPDDVKGKLFHRFQRGATRAHGKGLGLYLVRTLVEGYRGKVWVEDRVPGDHTQGARFVVMLPASDCQNSCLPGK
ncbi:PAS domain S-box protein [Methanocella sp. MCL-LM]|uniref:PAS domain S-box protein n=1 Tax=Methanocella sp. MCL-LM TaxID=3412035 RepID=UPI003C727F94